MPCMDTLSAKAEKNVSDIVRLAIKHAAPRKALVVFDLRTPLSRLLTEAYRTALPDATFMDFDACPPEAVISAIGTLTPGDLVVLVQSANFRLAAFRLRIELFQRGLATIEHVYLERTADDARMNTYLDALAYDPAYYGSLAHALKERIDRAKRIVVRCAGTELTYEGGMEPTKLNVGDYAGMKNVGGTFPIGEVFSEPTDLTMVNGEVMLFGFAGTDHLVQIHEPFKVRVERGILSAPDAPPEFREILDQIRLDEEVLVREFGLGLNNAMGKHRLLSDITAFERQKGLHLSLGEKHGIYKKPGFNPKKTRFHIDVFVDVERIEIDGEPIYANGDYLPNG